jgi:membrane protease YdiL (CAAX protease family)
VGLSLVFVYAVVAWLGWWRPVFVDDRPVRRWLWIVPGILIASVVLATNYGGLADKPVGFVVLLLVATQCVGFAEEGMFRGIGVTTFRVNGLSEGKVALWSSVVFGAVHLTNLIGGSGSAVAQAIAVTFAGYFFYLTRRVSRGLVLPAVVHGLFDLSLLSGSVVSGATYAGGLAPIAAYLAIGGILIARRHRIEPVSGRTSDPSA